MSAFEHFVGSMLSQYQAVKKCEKINPALFFFTLQAGLSCKFDALSLLPFYAFRRLGGEVI